MPRFAIVVGEASGDQLGRGLIESIRNLCPDAEFVGITGPEMRGAGCESWGDYEQLALMGLVEVLGHIPRILRLKRELAAKLKADPPDVFIGIDAPDFNLRLEKSARDLNIPTVHYVCPSVWAWRRGRVKTIRKACNLVLCLLPFEADFLHRENLNAKFVGHPIADEIGAGLDRSQCRDSLGIVAGPMLALLPGSRRSEVEMLGPPFLETVVCLRESRPDLRFVAAAATPATASIFFELCDSAGLADVVEIREGVTREVLGAADAVLLSSGTATLETMLMRRPMVVAYKVNAVTAWLARRLVKTDWASFPNLLAGEELVREFLQEEVVPEEMAGAVLQIIEPGAERDDLIRRFGELGTSLRCSASERAAEAVIELLDSQQVAT